MILNQDVILNLNWGEVTFYTTWNLLIHEHSSSFHLPRFLFLSSACCSFRHTDPVHVRFMLESFFACFISVSTSHC